MPLGGPEGSHPLKVHPWWTSARSSAEGSPGPSYVDLSVPDSQMGSFSSSPAGLTHYCTLLSLGFPNTEMMKNQSRGVCRD